MQTLTLQNETLRLEFDREHGRLVRLASVKTGWQILDRPHLGLAFRLLVPLPDRRNNPVFGERQKVGVVEAAPDGKSVSFIWDRVESEHGGSLGIRLTLTVTMDRRQAVFALTIENRSGYTIENVYCPCIGDLRPPQDAEYFKTFLPANATAQEWPLWPTYQNMKGYFGVDYPTQLGGAQSCGAPMSPFILFRGPREGLYAGVASSTSELVAWQTELRPGAESSMDERLPQGLSIGGKEVSLRFSAIHLPFLLPGESRSLTPVALECFQGGWQTGVDIYKSWRDGWMRKPAVPSWVREPHSWQQVHINSPEDELRCRFRDLPRFGEDCARHGVRAIQLVGWNDGGQDRGNPSHHPDPRLGTPDELREAIAKIQAMGVKVILFSKFTWADQATTWFRKDLVRQAIRDPYGDYYLHSGWQYQTATQLLDVNTRRLVPMCFLSQEYLQICDREFRTMLDLGADGILFDECMFHGNALFCFDRGHGHRPGAFVYANDNRLIERFDAIARLAGPESTREGSTREGSPPEGPTGKGSIGREFLFSGEACYDWEFQAYHVAYIRSRGKGHLPLMRYLQPDVPIVTAVYGFDDRQMVNQCLLYRYIASYEPYNFKGRLDDFPLTVGYGRRMDELRTELRDYFWDGEFLHELGARVSCEGRAHHPYSVFRNRANGKLGVVVANYDERREVTVEVKLEDDDWTGRYRLVDDARWRSAAEGVRLPPRSAAVVTGRE